MLGLVIAAYSIRLFDDAVQSSGAPYWLRFTIDYRVLAYVAAICVATGTLFGLAPALHVTRNNQHESSRTARAAPLVTAGPDGSAMGW